MSLINEALKQARAHTDAGKGPDTSPFGEPLISRPRRHRKNGNAAIVTAITAVAGVVVVALAAAGVFYLLNARTPQPGTAPGQPALAAADARGSTPSVTTPDAPETVNRSADTGPAPAAPVNPESAAAAVPATVAESATSATTPAPEVQPPTEEIDANYQVKGIMKTRNGFMALLNSDIVYEGDFLRDGAQIVAIAERYVDVRAEGQVYRLMFVRGEAAE